METVFAMTPPGIGSSAVQDGLNSPLALIFYIDNSRTDDYVETGASHVPFKTMTAAVEAAKDRYTLIFLQGDYSSEAPITLTKSLNLQAPSILNGILLPMLTITSDCAILASNVYFNGLTIDGVLFMVDCIPSNSIIVSVSGVCNSFSNFGDTNVAFVSSGNTYINNATGVDIEVLQGQTFIRNSRNVSLTLTADGNVGSLSVDIDHCDITNISATSANDPTANLKIQFSTSDATFTLPSGITMTARYFDGRYISLGSANYSEIYSFPVD